MRFSKMKTLLAATLALCLSTGIAFAQADKNLPDPPPAGTLSDKLDKSDGVVKPAENVDPNMKTVPPRAGEARTPVIAPPAEKDGKPADPK